MKNAPGVLSTAVRPQRFTLRVQQWGDRTRYAIVDGESEGDKVLAIRNTRAGTENELIVLNMNNERLEPSGPSSPGQEEAVALPHLSAA